MKVLLTDQSKIHIGWKYGQCPKSIVKDNRTVTIYQDCTTCSVRNESKEEIAVATIVRFHKDLPNKPLARKTTFRLAIANFSKIDKKLMWQEFLKTVKLK